MDPAEIRLIRKVVIKERGADGFYKKSPSPILWEPLKVTAPSRNWRKYEVPNCQLHIIYTHTARTVPLPFPSYKDWQIRNE